jgi:hypothetical protein
MAGKQAKILTRQQVVLALRRARRGRYPRRDRVMILLSVRAGLRAGEIAKLTWSMVLDAHRWVADRIELHDGAAKEGSGRHHTAAPRFAPRCLAGATMFTVKSRLALRIESLHTAQCRRRIAPFRTRGELSGQLTRYERRTTDASSTRSWQCAVGY